MIRYISFFGGPLDGMLDSYEFEKPIHKLFIGIKGGSQIVSSEGPDKIPMKIRAIYEFNTIKDGIAEYQWVPAETSAA